MTTSTRSAHESLSDAVTQTDRCRVCGSASFASVLDLGSQCLGNAYRKPGDAMPDAAPLHLQRCTTCSFVQLAHSVDGDRMYASYWYRSGVNDTMRRHLAEIAASATAVAGVVAGDVVIDIGCNDGTSLGCYPTGTYRIGVDPSNIRANHCDAHVNDYFSFAAVERALAGRKAKVVSSIAMFYDLDRPRDFAQDVRRCLADDGVWVLELSYLPAMLRTTSYDTICHEHVGYYRLATFEKVLDGLDLALFDVEFNASNGGSFRLWVAPRGACRATSDRLRRARIDESRLLLDTDAPYRGFRHQVERSRAAVRQFFQQAAREGKRVYGYGASTKGMVTLQHCGVTAEDLVAIADRNPDKCGLLVPGSEIPIVSEAEMRAAAPDYLFVLPWHFLDEFMRRERAFLEAGGKIVVPMPEFVIYDNGDVEARP